MIKFISTVLVALFLTACGSQDTAKEENTNSIKKVETTTAKTVEKNSTQEVATPPKSLTKNIFTLPTLDGKLLHVDEVDEGIVFQEHKNKVVFLLFFGYRCPPCLAEIPILKNITNEKHDDLEIIAIQVQPLSTERLKEFQTRKGINYTLLSAAEQKVSEFVSYVGQRAQWGGSIPLLIALDPSGEVKVVQVGGLKERVFNAVYKKLSHKK